MKSEDENEKLIEYFIDAHLIKQIEALLDKYIEQNNEDMIIIGLSTLVYFHMKWNF